VILALATSAVSVYIGYMAHREVGQFQSEFDLARSSRVNTTLAQFYEATEGWSGVQALIKRAGFLSDREIVVVNESGEVVGDSRVGQTSSPTCPHHFQLTPIVVGGSEVGSVMVTATERGPRYQGRFRGPPGGFPPPAVPEQFEEPQLVRFAEVINRSLVLAGLAACATGILLVSLVSRRVLGSVGNLTVAARALGSGDLSQRVDVKGHDEMAELGRTFNTMAGGLEDAERQRRNMVADIAHELRTPLSNIQGYTEALTDGLLKPDSATLDTIHQQVLYLSHLIEDLRLLAETEARDFRLNLELDSVDDVVRRAAEAFRPRAEAKRATLVIEIQDGLPPVTLDRIRIEQVIGNLVENAIRHTPSGGSVTVSAETPASILTQEGRRSESADFVTVTIADTGEGIPADVLPFVFDRFHRVDPSRDRETGGAGLGLTIARQLVEAHGGFIRAESTEGSGSRFVFDLPVEPRASSD